MQRLHLTTILTIVLAAAQQGLQADSPKICNPENGHFYQRIDEPMTWTEAQRFCLEAGGHLVTITSAAENTFVYSSLGIDGTNIWIGATDAASEGTWRWVTGESWTYDNWSEINRPQPDDAGGGQDYGIFWDLAPGTWDDNGLPHKDITAIFICEWEPSI